MQAVPPERSSLLPDKAVHLAVLVPRHEAIEYWVKPAMCLLYGLPKNLQGAGSTCGGAGGWSKGRVSGGVLPPPPLSWSQRHTAAGLITRQCWMHLVACAHGSRASCNVPPCPQPPPTGPSTLLGCALTFLIPRLPASPPLQGNLRLVPLL